MSNLARWSLQDSEELYNISGWGQGYFSINARGNVQAHPHPNSTQAIDLMDVVESARRDGLALPLLIRFSDILADRLSRLHNAFTRAMNECGYQGSYQGVFPMKVNQQRQVVEEVVRFGEGNRMGLEVGSKPELHAALAALETPDAPIICNGFKDAAYVRLALRATQLGRPVVLVLEKPHELPLVLRVSRAEGIRPALGARIRLVANGSGRWEDSGGDYSKFGLSSWELLEMVEHLREAGYLDCLHLLHAHLGSQINNLRRIREMVGEVSRYLLELHRLGAPITHVDLGGGLGVDYDGTRSTFGFSANYSEEEYAAAIVSTLGDACTAENVPHPCIVTESGRALTAHHAMLVLNVVGASTLAPSTWAAPTGEGSPQAVGHDLIDGIEALLAGVNRRSVVNHWYEAQLLRDEANRLFESGHFSLAQRARFDRTFWAVAARAHRLMQREHTIPNEFEPLEALLATKFYCNFSVFQSLPDAWAIHQEFPIMPLHRLGERPTLQGILQDITCDSDGRIGQYTGRHTQSETLPLHPYKEGEPYLLGVFLTGAYQEILGDLHNLFGDTNAIHVTQDGNGHWHCEQIVRGESTARILGYVQFHRELLEDRISRMVQQAQRSGRITPAQGKAFRELYAEGLEQLSYLEEESSLEENLAAPTQSGSNGA